MPRPKKLNNLQTARKELSFTKDEFVELAEYVDQSPGTKLGTWMRDTLLNVARGEVPATPPEDIQAMPVPALGYIHAGDAMTVTPLPPGATVRPPFALNEDCYALIVTGDSMEREAGVSIPDGSYAFFCPDIIAQYGAVVHVEWPMKDGEHECTLKRYCPNADGSVAFEPFNKRHKAITKKEGEFEIRGVFVRAWKGEPKT